MDRIARLGNLGTTREREASRKKDWTGGPCDNVVEDLGFTVVFSAGEIPSPES